VVIDTSTGNGWQQRGPGHRVLELFNAADGEEVVSIEQLAAGGRHDTAEAEGGEELLVLAGVLQDEHGTYGEGAWVRNPPGFVRHLVSANGCRFWRKGGHLRNVVSS
jgi:anti-sigma factor ChrR (cupin superfamily)